MFSLAASPVDGGATQGSAVALFQETAVFHAAVAKASAVGPWTGDLDRPAPTRLVLKATS